MPGHNPNPFDFVPFAENPFLRTPEEFDSMGELLSGYLEVQLKALTPVHIVGHQTSAGMEEGTSHMYRQNGVPCIPAASVRGCLRGFIEALTSGWVSQANLEYPKKYGKSFPEEGRHIGFRAFAEYPPDIKQTLPRTSPPAIGLEFEACLRPDRKIDLASYLFGMVLEERKDVESRHADLARKSKIIIEDALLSPDSVASDRNWVPDVQGKSFMGGGKPSASTWWYMKPDQYWVRTIRTPNGLKRVAEFVGGQFWGRKFYYHQEPQKCVQYYQQHWNFDPKCPLYTIHLECHRQNTSSETFRIYLDKVPRPLACLFVLALNPGQNIRHKLGYGKAYGYGSVEFIIEHAWFRNDDPTVRIPAPLVDSMDQVRQWAALAWDDSSLKKYSLDNFIIDFQALECLSRVLGWQDHLQLLFTYPPYASTFFKQPISETQLKQAINQLGTDKSLLHVAENLFNLKKPIHFRLYQEKANGWEYIRDRKP